MDQTARSDPMAPTAGSQAGGTAWRRALVVLAILSISLSAVSIETEGVSPSAVVFSLLLLAGLWRLRAGATKGTVLIGVSALVFFLVHIPFTAAALSDNCVNPANAARGCSPTLWMTWLGLVPLLTVGVAGVARREAMRRPSP